jgi:hypothetical protein
MEIVVPLDGSGEVLVERIRISAEIVELMMRRFEKN